MAFLPRLPMLCFSYPDDTRMLIDYSRIWEFFVLLIRLLIRCHRLLQGGTT